MKQILIKSLQLLNRREKRVLAALVITCFLISVADLASLAVLLLLINFYVQHQFPAILSFLPQRWFRPGSATPMLIFLVLFGLKSLAGYLIYRAQYRFVYSVASRLSQNGLLQYLEGTYTDYINEDSSVYIRRISQQPIEFCHYVLAGLQQMITEGLLAGLSVAAIALFNVKLFLLLFTAMLPAVLLVSVLIKKKVKSVRTHIRTQGETALRHLREALNGYIESNVYYKNEFFTQRYAVAQEQMNEYLARLQAAQGMPSRLIEVFAVLGIFILIAVHAWWGNSGAINLLTIGAFMAAAYKIIPGLVKIITLGGQVKTYSFTLEDMPGIKKTPGRDTLSAPAPITDIRAEKVSFSYRQKQVLDRFSLHLQRGNMIGLSALSGKGKTTLIQLLMGFLEPGEGRILINHQPCDAGQRQVFRQRIAYVKQQPFLLHDTIATNITLETIPSDKARLTEVLAATGLTSVVHKYPEGADKIITESGKNISGGQRQRIALARALYKQADLIILDEPFSELDERSERLLLKHLRKLCEAGKMVLLVTHNKESLAFCDQIISLDEACC